jgi:SAP domain-containing ribonucleoprotein
LGIPVSDLRAALSLRGLSTEGLKVDLVNRLQARLDEEEFGMVDAPVAVDTTATTTIPATDDDDEIEDDTVVGSSKVTTSSSTTTAAAAAAAATPPVVTTSPTIPKPASESNGGKGVTMDASSSTTTITAATTTATAGAGLGPPTASSSSVKITHDMSFEQKKLARAARFGAVDTTALEHTKKQVRAERFGLTTTRTTTNTTMATSSSSSSSPAIEGGVSKKQKVETNATEEPLPPKDELEKRLQRLNKFGGESNKEEIDKIKSMLRVYRFQKN